MIILQRYGVYRTAKSGLASAMLTMPKQAMEAKAFF